jgi:hypothetical protein
MQRMRFGKAIAVVLSIALLGCSREPAPVPVTTTVSPAKPVLEEISNTGQLGSGIMEVETAIEGMKKTDAAKAEKLSKELQDLRAETDEAKIKTKAKALADQF